MPRKTYLKKVSPPYIVKKERKKEKPSIIVKDLALKSNYYRVTKLELKNKEKYYVYWNDENDFKRGFSRLKRRESTHFTNDQIVKVSTRTHRYSSTSFTAKGFKP